MTNRELVAVEKADIALSDLSSGGLLNTEQANTFFRKVIDQPTIINECRTVGMSSPKREINKVGFGSRIMRAANQAVSLPWGSGTGRSLSSTQRVKPDLGKVTLDTKELIAEIRLPYEVIEDNIERENFSDTVMELISERVSLDLEEWILLGDTSSADTYLALNDGVLKLAAGVDGHVVDALGATVSKDVFRDSIKAMPDKFLRTRDRMRFYTSVDNETQYRDTLANRMTGLGDSMITGLAPVYAFGTPVAPVALMPSTKALFLDPKNIIVGFHREVMIETDKIIQERVWVVVLTVRVDVKVEEVDASVLIQNIG